jgi:CheY-like chemotaxis protein
VQADDRAALRGLNVLIVEDNADSRDVLSVLVQGTGASVTAAENGEVALGILEQRQPVDVVLSDIGMPVRDGFWLVREIRSRQRFRHIPVIAVTAMVSPVERRTILAAGFHAHVPKPIKFDALVETIRRVVLDAPNRADTD